MTNPIYTKKRKSVHIKNSISVDAACSGNPGEMQYKGVNTMTGELLFSSKLYPKSTNNIGEFLAVVHALRYAAKIGVYIPIYTDSESAIAWVENIKVKTSLYRDESTEELFRDIDRAISWLKTHEYLNPVLKWNTKAWGESKADFGRKTYT